MQNVKRERSYNIYFFETESVLYNKTKSRGNLGIRSNNRLSSSLVDIDIIAYLRGRAFECVENYLSYYLKVEKFSVFILKKKSKV